MAPRAWTVTLLVTGLTLGTAACSSDSGTVRLPAAGASSATTPAAAASPFAGLSAADILAAARAEAQDAESVHVAARSGTGKDQSTFNLKLTASGKGYGVIGLGGQKVTVRRLGRVMYLKADREFWLSNADSATADELAGRWIRSTKGSSPAFDDFFALTDLAALLDESLVADDPEALRLVPGLPGTAVATVGLADFAEGKAGPESGTLFVAAGGDPLPTDVVNEKDSGQYLKFRGWNGPVRVAAPKGAFDLDAVS